MDLKEKQEQIRICYCLLWKIFNYIKEYENCLLFLKLMRKMKMFLISLPFYVLASLQCFSNHPEHISISVFTLQHIFSLYFDILCFQFQFFFITAHSLFCHFFCASPSSTSILLQMLSAFFLSIFVHFYSYPFSSFQN